jgi:hypothetical protein
MPVRLWKEVRQPKIRSATRRPNSGALATASIPAAVSIFDHAGLTLAPVLVKNLNPVFRFDKAHVSLPK